MLQLLRESLKPWYLYFTSSDYREWLRIKRTCRRQAPKTVFSTRVAGFTIDVHDAASLLDQYEAIFRNRCYDFNVAHKDPTIICCGANIGLEILFFKKKYPDALIIAFEADAKIAELLHKNVSQNALSNVLVHHAAVWTSDGEITFTPDGQQGGRIGEGSTLVKTMRLADELKRERPIDLLIMDIEGAEYEVLSNCRHVLHRVERLFVEWHSPVTRMQQLDELLVLLQLSGFRYRLQNNLPEAPLANKLIENGFDAMVDIYAEKSGHIAGRPE